MAQDLSEAAGPTSPPLLETTIGAAFDAAAARWADREALVSVHQDIRWTYAEFAAHVDAFAAGLLALGLEPGDRLGIWSPNNAEWAVTQFAAAKAGVILVTINPAYRLSEVEYTLNKVGVKALVCAERFKTSDYAGMLETLAPEIRETRGRPLASQRLTHLRHVIQVGGETRPGYLDFWKVRDLAGADGQTALRAIGAGLSNRDPINIQFTSGTTGLPKGATLTHRNILNNGYFVGLSMGLREGDRLCVPVPLYHCFGMVMSNLSCVTHGATIVYPSEGFDAQAVLSTVEREKCTGLQGVPTMFIAELEHPGFAAFDLSSLRTGVMAGSPCPIEVMRQVIERMHMRDVTIAYGMTETSPVSVQSSIDDPLERRVSTVGRVQPHLSCKIVDEAGATAPRGQPGEICTRGYSVMVGYWDEPERTAEAIDAGGWMHTGDLAVMDAEGYVNIVGRKKDMVIRGGENIYPREIEEFLYRHAKVAEVQVVGVPDEKYGEELCAWIRIAEGEALTAREVRAYCAGQIAHYKIPRYIRFVDDFPMTITGKVQKFAMREQMIRELSLREVRTA